MSLDEPAVFDPNTWYQLSEARVDVGGRDLAHNLVIIDSPPGFGVLPNDNNYWQFVPTDDDVENRFFLRSLKSGTNFHLATCWHPEEKHEGKTRLCLATASDSAKDQKWDAFLWNDGTTGVRFVNVKNGTDWWLDVHKGNPPFMNDNIDTGVFRPAQRWFVSSRSAVGEANFRIGDASPTKTPGTSVASDVESSSTPTLTNGPGSDRAESDDSGSSSSGTGLSTGAAAGIGVGATAAVALIVAVVFFLMRRRKPKGTNPIVADYLYGNGPYPEKTAAVLPHEAPATDTGAHEIEGFAPLSPHAQPSELDASPRPSHPPISSTAQASAEMRHPGGNL